MSSRKTRVAWTVAAVVVTLAVVAAGVWYLFGSGGEPTLTSPWPKADSERSIVKPPEPATWPLTGLPVTDAGAPAATRVVSVKIENSPEARPQSGLNSADVVYETITEGGITRFNCMFHSTDPGEVGPVRSARLSDIDIVPQYAALFVFSGASGPVNAAVSQAGLQNLSEDRGVTYGYRRARDRKAPHNLYVDLSMIREEGLKREYPATQELRPLQFEKRAVEATPTVTRITVPFSTANTVSWNWDAATDRYLRENNGSVHTDRLTGDQVSAKNVVVMWAKMVAAAKRDVAGSTTYDIELAGTNRATVFRNGTRLDGTWEATAGGPPTFKAADGTAIRLAPGNTWFQVVPVQVNITMQ